MALSASTAWEVRSTGNSANGGGFNVGNSNFATDLAATSGTSSAPVVSSASYTFVAGDVGALVFIKSGTNWTPGFYPIASVSGGAATLTASVGSVVLYGGATVLNTAAGCATTASPTGGTWGVDYSQQDSARFTFTDLVIDGATNTKFTSAANPVGKNFTANILNFTSGTGFTVQRREVVSTSGTTATCDASLGTLSSTGGNGKLGGALDSFATLASSGTTSNQGWVKTSGGYTSTATTTFGWAGVNPTNSATPNRLIGYTTYRGDGGHAVLTLSTNTGLSGLLFSNNGWVVENIDVDCASLGTSIPFNFNGAENEIRNCKASNFTQRGIFFNSNDFLVERCEITGGGSSTDGGVRAGTAPGVIRECHIHDNSCPGIFAGAFITVLDNLIVNNTGASSDGIQIVTGRGAIVAGNTIYGNGRHGINNTTTSYNSWSVRNNILAGNGGYGLVGASGAGGAGSLSVDGNAYWNNTSGTRSNIDDRGTTNPINGVVPYVNSLDVILTADPFVAKASGDFRLNSTAGGGAAARGHGVPASWPGNSLTTSAPDMGASQHVDSGGGGTTIFSGEF